MKTSHYFLIITVLFAVSCKMEVANTGVETPEELAMHCEPVQALWDGERPADAYDYPVRPGMEEWKNLKTGQEMRDACQVPFPILKEMSTQAIIQAILEHPTLFQLFMANNVYQYYLDRHLLTENSCMELVHRKDAAAALLDRLLLVDPLKVGIPQKYEAPMVELFLSRKVFLSWLDDCEKRSIVETTLKNDSIRRNNVMLAIERPSDVNLSRTISAILIGKTMYAAGYSPFCSEMRMYDELRFFVEGAKPWFSFPNDSGLFEPGFGPYEYPFAGSSRFEFVVPRIMGHGKKFINK